ncbi:hypothetical protein [Streptomyces sp. TLI_105]|uniref:hypothetical protein n=1 Tax=Streptomyces sp. TLI_105 TaxID=1881019 RepID=UPI000898587A|nr:hypothetical protein [Streptomyces sp. TLI_105]SED05553.1 hypothetical protein SAMN05428939_4069 [Streptomyces sp. TLI_105]
MGDTKKKSRRWIWLVVGLLALCGLPVTFLAWGAYSLGEGSRTQPVDCADAMEFARGRLPAGAEDARCTGTHWQDSYITVDFRMPRAGVADWLRTTYPSGRPPVSCDGDLCLDVDFDQALYVDVKVVYEDGGTALVHLGSFDL